MEPLSREQMDDLLAALSPLIQYLLIAYLHRLYRMDGTTFQPEGVTNEQCDLIDQLLTTV